MSLPSITGSVNSMVVADKAPMGMPGGTRQCGSGLIECSRVPREIEETSFTKGTALCASTGTIVVKGRRDAERAS